MPTPHGVRRRVASEATTTAIHRTSIHRVPIVKTTVDQQMQTRDLRTTEIGRTGPEQARCPACEQAIEIGQSVIWLHGVALHVNCAVYRRRRVR
jgi:hypothetical protein